MDKKTVSLVIVILIALSLVLSGSALAAQGTPLPGKMIPQFVDPLPVLDFEGGTGLKTIIAVEDEEIKLHMLEFQANMMPSTFVPAAGTYTGTWVWGYLESPTAPITAQGTYLGPVIVATRNIPTQIRFVNSLTATNIAWRDWTDQTLHWADPFNTGMSMDHYMGPIPAVPHIHGGDVPPVLDGGPDSWFTSDGIHGHAYYAGTDVVGSGANPAAANESIYRYPNGQEAAMIWFHDHLLGGTRLNVYAGLAGAYPIIDPELALPTGMNAVGLNNGTLDLTSVLGPSGANTELLIPLVIQDRMFDTNGQLFFPNIGINPEHPYWIPEFVGDTIVVNGKVWPHLDVAPKRYRFLFVNGSNARTYEMFLVNPVTKVMGPAIYQIGTDGGYLDAPVKIDPNAAKPALTKLVIMPGERADVIVDFSGLAGQTLILRNIGRTPFPKGAPPDGTTLGRIIQIRVNQPFAGPDASYDPASGAAIRTGTNPPTFDNQKIVRLVNPATGTLAPGVIAAKTRQLTLNEVMGAGGPLEVLVNNTKWNGKQADGSVRMDFTPVTVGEVTEYYSELPKEGETEIWEVINLTADAHPIHTHLTQFQLINRQNFNVSTYNAAYAAAFPGGVYVPAYGPPYNYDNSNNPHFCATLPTLCANLTTLGGNPDVTLFRQGLARPPELNEGGWKDTVTMYPGQVTRIAVRYAPTDKPIDDLNLSYLFDPNAGGHGYVWHCHIVDHEDNEMMRPFAVVPMAGVMRTYEIGVNY